jgi:hypothetical protein
MDRREAREVITGALKTARERVVGELDAKEIQRERLADLIVRMDQGAGSKPTAEDIRDALGDPDDGRLRRAIEAWSQEDTPVVPR